MVDIFLERPFADKMEKIFRSITQHLIPFRQIRKNGISAIMLTRDEPLFKQSLKDILPLVDEVVVVDAGKKKVSVIKSDKVIYVRTEPEQNTQFKIGLLLSHYHWIIRWDADFLLNDETERFIEYLRTNNTGYWMVKCHIANVSNGKIENLQNEAYAFTYHPLLLTSDWSLLMWWINRIIMLLGHQVNTICYNVPPWFFGMKKIDMVFADHHYKSKSERRILEKLFQREWGKLSERERFDYGGFDEFVEVKTATCRT